YSSLTFSGDSSCVFCEVSVSIEKDINYQRVDWQLNSGYCPSKLHLF
uniref:Leptin receptor n=1 Tax=Ascaris lumbricoides TaxID=6252 RepID=A0A0M3IMI6_ASCLU